MTEKQRATMEKADELAKSYLRNKEMIDSLLRDQTATKSRIKTFAAISSLQTQMGRETLVFGREFAVGFLKTDGTKSVDYYKLFLMRPDLRKKLCRFVPVEELVEKAVRNGFLPRKILAKCLIQTGPPQKRVVVKSIKKKGKHESTDEG
jgi:hypothetical protein